MSTKQEQLNKQKRISFFKFVSSSLFTTVLDVAIYSFSINRLERYFPIFYTFISTLIARFFSDSLKYHLDKHLVFKSDEKNGYFKYLLLVVMNTLSSAIIVTIIAALGIDYEEIVKMIVDVLLFFPTYFISKKWIHKTEN